MQTKQPSRNTRFKRSYAPKGLLVLSGPNEVYEKGALWMLANSYGYAQVEYLPDVRACHPETLYIENLEIKAHLRDRGHGRDFYHIVEQFAKNIGASYIQIDSELDACGFWVKMGFSNSNKVYYHGKVVMIKELL